jgi:hypothetical protein
MLFEKKDLPEYHTLIHRFDDNSRFIRYEDNILNFSLSPYMFKNKMMAGFLDSIRPMVTYLSDKFNVVKNFYNYTVHKHDYRHTS